MHEYIQEKLSEQGCKANCLSSFSVGEVYQFQFNLLDMSKVEKACLLGKLHFLSRAGEETAHACKKDAKRQRATYKYAFDHSARCKKAFLFLHDVG